MSWCNANAMQTWTAKHAGHDIAPISSNSFCATVPWPGILRREELQKLCSLNFHFKEVKNRLKNLGL